MLVFPIHLLLPIAAPRGIRRGSVATRLLGLRVRIPPGPRMSVYCECCALSGRGLCVGLFNRPEQSYCDREASTTKRSWFIRRQSCHKTQAASIIDTLKINMDHSVGIHMNIFRSQRVKILSGHLPRKPTTILIQDKRCASRNSNRSLPIKGEAGSVPNYNDMGVKLSLHLSMRLFRRR
jgi:hypothetical protein